MFCFQFYSMGWAIQWQSDQFNTSRLSWMGTVDSDKSNKCIYLSMVYLYCHFSMSMWYWRYRLHEHAPAHSFFASFLNKDISQVSSTY